MAEDEDRLARIERTLAQLEQSMREGWALVEKQVEDFRRETERRQQDLSLGLQGPLSGIGQHLTDLQERLTRLEDRFSRLDLRLDTRLEGLDTRLDTRLASIDDRLNTRLMGVEGRLSAIEGRLDHKAGNWVVSLWGATLAILIGAATAFIRFAR
jgi:chromosome segregation ATPase